MIGFRYYHREKEWSAVFIDSCMGLSEEGRLQFCRQTTDMYLDKKRTAKLKGEGYEGLAIYAGYGILEGIGGPRFILDLETETGKQKVDMIVLEQRVDASLN
ncbi:hypothetical protein J4218_05830 [Candidatus Pacearchaeota archaeon]|nr:hypothetical protein [Candidatus Pacearchaeota archaeon]